MSDYMNFENIMKQAKDMQKSLEKIQAALTETSVTGVSGAGLVKITMNGRHEVTGVSISETLMVDNDKEMIEDLVIAAFNDAVRKVEEKSKEKLAGLTAGMSLPSAGSKNEDDN